jgi:hypothetical protein
MHVQMYWCPAGPAVSHRWCTAVDAAIGKELSNFIVHDVHDMRLLRGLACQAGMGHWLSVTQMSYDLPQHTMPPARLPPSELLTLLQVGGVVQASIIDRAAAKLVIRRSCCCATPEPDETV